MLVLTRKQNEKIQIGDSITITVVRTKGKTVRLGIDAPAEMAVLRGELVFELDADEAPADATEEAEAPRRSQRSRAATTCTTRDNGWSTDAGETVVCPAGARTVALDSTNHAPLRSQVAARK